MREGLDEMKARVDVCCIHALPNSFVLIHTQIDYVDAKYTFENTLKHAQTKVLYSASIAKVNKSDNCQQQ